MTRTLCPIEQILKEVHDTMHYCNVVPVVLIAQGRQGKVMVLSLTSTLEGCPEKTLALLQEVTAQMHDGLGVPCLHERGH